MSKKKQNHELTWETLEDRQLLNAGGVGRLASRAVQIAPTYFGRQPSNHQAMIGAARSLGQNQLRGRFGQIPQGSISTDYAVLRPNSPIAAVQPQLNVPRSQRAQAPQPTSAPSNTTNTYSLNPSYLGLGTTTTPRPVLGQSISFQPRAYTSIGGTLQPINGGLNYQLAIPKPATNPNMTGETTASTANAAASTASIGGFSDKMIAPPFGAGNAADSTSSFAPIPYDMLDGATLSPALLETLRTAASDLNANHTRGADPAKDKAAISAFQGVLDEVAMNVWTQVNVTTKESAVAIKDAATQFSENYTAGADPSKDVAAWKAFNTAMGEFTRSIRNPNAPDQPVNDGPMADGPWLSMPMMMAGSNIKYLASGLLDGQSIIGDDLDGIQAAVNDFADHYTSGKDKTVDLAAGESLLNAIGEVMSKRWERLAPPELRDPSMLAARMPHGAPKMAPNMMGREPFAPASTDATLI